LNELGLGIALLFLIAYLCVGVAVLSDIIIEAVRKITQRMHLVEVKAS